MELSMAYDYEIRITLNGKVGSTTYQNLIRLLGIENEMVQGQPLKAGGAPQALFIKELLAKTPQYSTAKIEVLFNGSVIF
jgi:hypothetical protein